jgi:PAS domain S-box-containing protein
LKDRAAAEPEESVDSLRYKIEEYERRFRLLDEQMRILERERQKLSAVVHQTDVGFLVMDSAPKVIWANSVFARRFLDSSHPGALLGQPCHRVLCGRDAACEECPAARPFQSAEVAHHELKIEIHGRPRYLYATAMPIKSMTGETDQVIVMVQDVSNLTVLQQSQQALRASEEKFRSIVLNAAAGVVMVNPEGRLLMVNPAYCRFLGYTEAELLERTVMDITHPEDLERTHNAFPQPDGSYSRAVELEKRYLRKDGTIAWAHVSSSWLVDESGRPRNAVALVLDVGERKRAEQELRSSEARKGAILVTALDAIISIDHEGRITEFNPAAEALFGYSREEALGSRMADLIIPPSLREAHSKGFHHYLTSGESPLMGKHIELTAMRKDGSEVPVEIAFNRVPLTGLPAFTGYIRDLTERKRTEAALREREEQLRHSQKMEAVGTLAGGIAHDFNNILTGILGYADLLQIQSSPGDKVHHAAEVIAKGATRAAQLTQQLLGFARKGKNQNIPVDLHAVVQEVVTLLTGSLPAGIRIQVELAVDPFWVRGDPVQLGQVILNLAMNAAEAMPKGGDLSITTRRVEPSEEILRRHPGFDPGSRLLLHMADTGTGIPESVRGRIFEPFFTTKADGKGSGMGLAMVYGTVQNHGGFIEVDSRLGQGTEFSIYLPEASPKAGADRRLPLGKPIPGTGRILVVDDEETVRGVAREFLKRLGYQVLTASDGQEAVETYRASAQEIDLVILDMVMPRLGGRECFRALKQINPEVRAVLCTGYGFNVATQEILDEGMAGFLQKPYQMSQLSEIVAAALKS